MALLAFADAFYCIALPFVKQLPTTAHVKQISEKGISMSSNPDKFPFAPGESFHFSLRLSVVFLNKV